MKCVKCCLKTENDCLKTQTKHPLSFLKIHFFIMHFLKNQLFHYALLQKALTLNIQENYSTWKTFPPFFINPSSLLWIKKQKNPLSLLSLSSPALSLNLYGLWIIAVGWHGLQHVGFVGRATAPSQGRGRLMVAWLGSCNDSAGSHQCLGSFFFCGWGGGVAVVGWFVIGCFYLG